MRIAISGVTGFIGRVVLAQAPSEYELLVLKRPEADLSRPESYRERLAAFKPDVVVNLAARIGTMLTRIPVGELYETNTLGALNLAYAAKETGALAYVFTSSTVVHGENRGGEPHKRNDLFAPKQPYAASKASAELGLEQFAKEGDGMSVITLRPPMVIGKGTDIPLPPIEFVRSVLSGKTIEIFGEGLHEREFVSVEDVARGIWDAVAYGSRARKGYEPFFLTGNPISMRELAERVARKFGGKVVFVPKTMQAFSLTTDPVDSKRVLGWEVRDDLDAILADVGQFVSKESQA